MKPDPAESTTGSASSLRYRTPEYREWNRERMRRLRADPEYRARQNEREAERLTGVAYSRKLLKNRRYKALRRMAKRNQTRKDG